MKIPYKQEPLNQFIYTDKKNHVSLYIKREDLIHPTVSGNKLRKLNYNLAYAEEKNFSTLLTFGGAFSNHIAATAEAAKRCGFKSVGIIRGEELGNNIAKTFQNNHTLKQAHENGMELRFISRAAYRGKETQEFLDNINAKYPNAYILPEGGTNALAIKGCEEILTKEDYIFDYVTCASGTGGTVAGIINSAQKHQQVLAFSALKGDFLQREIEKFTHSKRWKLMTSYHFGGYAKVPVKLVDFINDFKRDYGILLDPIYTGKMLYGIIDLIKNEYFAPHSKILAIHTGGIQGIHSINTRLKAGGRTLINTNYE
ncbi:pyridoxal-phosphate dependent enzyme [Gangjinia marincola]|uniref:Pyridoxal-phosphate dependent enzyme n=1 Tax=Gangjinia marincola TaxID=578463 RepID=A0ABP3XSY7_9FLAO